MFQLHQHGKLRRRVAGEIKADGRLHHLGFSRRLHMDVEDQIGGRIGPPRHPVGLLPWDTARLPEQEVAVRIEGIRFDAQIHARRAFPRHAPEHRSAHVSSPQPLPVLETPWYSVRGAS